MIVAEWKYLAWRRACVFFLATGFLLSGCRHRQAPPTLPPVLKAPDAQPPTPEAPAMDGVPPPSLIKSPPPVKVTELPPPKRTRRSTQKRGVTATPTETANAMPPATPASSVGALTTGGEVNSKAQQETADLIAYGNRRLDALSVTKAREQQPDQLKEIRRFLDQAKEALGSGDAEGAKTLGTKAKLLLDDLDRWAQK